MPIYDYKCQVCGEAGEYIVDADSKPPKCCKKPMKKQVSTGTRFVLKGSGWSADCNDHSCK